MMEAWENEPMPKELHWRLVRAFENGDINEIKRLNRIWMEEARG